MRTVKGILLLTRPYVLFTTSTFYIAAAFLSTNSIPHWFPFFVGFLAVSLAIASTHTLNDFFDRKNDKENPRTAQRAIPSGLVSPRLALALGVIYGICAVSLTFFLNLLCITLAFTAIALPFMYEIMRKRQISYSFLCTMVAVFFIILFGSATISGQYWTNYIPLFVIFGVSWEMGRTLISEVQDVDYDKVTNVTTISVAISSKGAARLVLLSFSITSMISVLIGVYVQLGFIYLAVAFGASCWLIYHTLELVRTPTTSNAIRMHYRAPKYLVTISLILVLVILANTFFLSR